MADGIENGFRLLATGGIRDNIVSEFPSLTLRRVLP